MDAVFLQFDSRGLADGIQRELGGAVGSMKRQRDVAGDARNVDDRTAPCWRITGMTACMADIAPKKFVSNIS